MPAITSARSLESRSGESDTARLSAAVVLSQVLLLEGKHDLYAELATETLAPLLLKLRRSPPAAQPSSNPLDLARQVPDLAGGLALLPLASRRFLSGLSDAALKSTAARWEALRGEANDDLGRLAVDLVLEATYRQLGQELERRQAVERLEHNPARTVTGTGSGGPDARRQRRDDRVHPRACFGHGVPPVGERRSTAPSSSIARKWSAGRDGTVHLQPLYPIVRLTYCRAAPSRSFHAKGMRPCAWSLHSSTQKRNFETLVR